MVRLVLIDVTAPALYTSALLSYMCQPLMVCPAVGDADALKLTGDPTVELFKGVETLTVGLVAFTVSVSVWSPNAPDVSHARTITVWVPVVMLRLVLIELTAPAL